MEERLQEMTKVVVEIHLDFTEESDKALRTLFEVAEELLETKGVWVDIIPVHLWFENPIEADLNDLPKVFINGKLRFIGKAPSRKELISAILERVGSITTKREEPVVESTRFFDGGFSDVALVTV